jgi:hypothetical protein
MARELGLNPAKLGKLDNADQEPWKAPLPQFIEHLYANGSAATAPTSSKPSRKSHAKPKVAEPIGPPSPPTQQATTESSGE